MTSDELEMIFKEYFPLELDKKSLAHVFKQYCALQNKTLINYKLIKEEINSIILEKS